MKFLKRILLVIIILVVIIAIFAFIANYMFTNIKSVG